MEEDKNIRPLKAAIIIGVSNFLGFSLVYLLMMVNMMFDWKNFSYLLPTFLILVGYFLLCGIAVIGIIIAGAIGLVAHVVFKFLIPKNFTNKQIKIVFVIFCIVCFAIGVLLFQPVNQFVRELQSGKEHVGTVDTVGDGKAHKWVHNDIYDRLTEVDYDANLDGKPDVWEYYKNGEVYKKEIDTDYDGKPNIREYYKNGKLVKKEIIVKPIKNDQKK
ncbi:MAG: hypothetical protein PHP73_06330 [Candidatus Omnitrophica bacterium]|nr:hypothetical protein [Candidatus Omnitrophota bacterium]